MLKIVYPRLHPRLPWIVCALAATALNVVAQQRAEPAENVLRNAGFELDRVWNGGAMRQGGELKQAQRQYHQKELAELPVEAWWVEGREATGVELTPNAHSGERALRVTGPASVISALDPSLPAGPVTLSAWVQAKGATGRLELLLPEGKPVATVDLPPGDGWQRVSASAVCPDSRRAVIRLRVTEGTLIIDDVQIQSAEQASAFALRPAESLRLALADHDPAELPRWVTGDATPRKVTVYHDTPSPTPRGPIQVWLGPWDEPKQRLLGELSPEQLPASLEFSAADLRPDAYILTVSTSGLDGADAFDPTVPIEGKVSRSMTAARTALRIGIAPDTQAADIFGVGNYMVHTGGDWYRGTPMEDYVHAGRLGMVSGRGPDYNLAAGGLLGWKKGPWPETRPPKGAPFVNPAAPKLIDIHHPDGWAFIMARAEEEGRRTAANPFAAAYKMRNERLYAMDGKACPSEHADAAFREWCRDRHGDLATLNERWGVAYTDWSEVEQVMSANRFHLAKEQPERTGAAAVDWTASTGHFGPEGVRYMRAHPGQAMDWMRWRSESGLRLWREVRRHARKHDPKTLYSNNLCWPNFWPQMFMPFVRDMDVVMLDCQYTAGSGLPRGLGTPYEMIEILEMAESIDRTKPVWGLEIYVQPRWPAEFTALQNWAMVAHGMRNNQVFGWKPYSDSGQPKGNRAWENGDNRPMWFMIDNDGTHLPNYHANARSISEINRFHQRFNGLSLRRHPTDIAVYVSNDTAEFVIMDTGNRPYDSMWCHTRNNVAYLLRMEGITADYVDDDSLPAAPGRFRTLIVPAAPVLSQDAADRLAAFARAGGTVVLAGICGQRDPWLRPYENLGGPAWEDLQWKADAFTTDERGFFMRGKHPGTMREALPVLDTAGMVTGWQRPWGKGRLIASAVFPAAYTGSPHATQVMLDWIRKLIKLAELPFTGRWRGDTPPTGPETEREKGIPVVEVVVRPADNGDRFVFVLNQGGTGSGVVEVPLPDSGRWQAGDVLTDKSVKAHVKDRLWSWHIELAPWEYRVIRLYTQ